MILSGEIILTKAPAEKVDVFSLSPPPTSLYTLPNPNATPTAILSETKNPTEGLKINWVIFWSATVSEPEETDPVAKTLPLEKLTVFPSCAFTAVNPNTTKAVIKNTFFII